MKTRCNQFSNSCPNRIYQYNKEYHLKKCCRNGLMNILDKIPYIMEQADWWLEFGTLLGFVREGKIIDWDNDLDVGVTENSFHNNITKIKSKCEEFNFNLIYKKEEDLYKIIYGPNNYLFCDIWLFRKLDNNIFDAISPVTPAVHEGYFIEKKDLLEINNKMYFIPRNTEEFLIRRYGPSWRNPVKSMRSLPDGRLIKLQEQNQNIIEGIPRSIMARYEKF